MTISLHPDPDWVDAHTYRTHVTQLLTATGISWRLLAAYAGLSPRALDTLLHGRAGRRVRVIHVTIARALNSLDADTLTDAETTWIDKRTPHHLLGCLQMLGHDLHTLPWVTPDDIHALQDVDDCRCTAATSARVQAAYDLLTTHPIPAAAAA
ncbi:hypothetical protein GCM10027418_04890 [Mariniluteicoccus endophyticus]